MQDMEKGKAAAESAAAAAVSGLAAKETDLTMLRNRLEARSASHEVQPLGPC